MNPQCRMNVHVLYWAHVWCQGNAGSGVPGKSSGDSGSSAEPCSAGEGVLEGGIAF